jgi:hypothetical protein
MKKRYQWKRVAHAHEMMERSRKAVLLDSLRKLFLLAWRALQPANTQLDRFVAWAWRFQLRSAVKRHRTRNPRGSRGRWQDLPMPAKLTDDVLSFSRKDQTCVGLQTFVSKVLTKEYAFGLASRPICDVSPSTGNRAQRGCDENTRPDAWVRGMVCHRSMLTVWSAPDVRGDWRPAKRQKTY